MHMPQSKDNQNTQRSLRSGVPLLNGGSGGTDPQIRVLPTPAKSATHKYLSFTTTLITNIHLNRDTLNSLQDSRRFIQTSQHR
jgi:hypothetical protein